MDVIELENQILGLPANDRALLATRLLESLDAQDENKVHQEWVAEIKKRLATIDAGDAKFLRGSEALAYLSNA